MDTQHLFLTEDGFPDSRWRAAFPLAQISTSTTTAPHPQQLVWVLTGISTWQEQIRHHARQGIKVIALTRNPQLEELREALECGARGYVEALANQQILRQVADTVDNGALWLPAPLVSSVIGVVSQLLETRHPGAPGADLSCLTERERAVAEAVCSGASNKQVARQLNITERTVKAHLSSIFEKLGVRDRMHLLLHVRGGEGSAHVRQA